MFKPLDALSTLPGRFAGATNDAPVHIDASRRAARALQLALLVLVGLLLRIPHIQAPGYRDDISIFAGWFKSIAQLPLASVYANTPGLNYPPMCVLMYKVESIVLGWFVHGPISDSVMNVVVKLPPILFDCAGAVLVYCIVRRTAAHSVALLAAAFIAFNPAIIYDSAFWGQNDCIPTLLALFALSQLLSRRTIVGWIAITVAVLFKPPVLVLVPLMLLHPLCVPAVERRAQWRDTALGVIGAFLVALATSMAFFDHPTILVSARHLVAQFLAFSNVFAFTSLNAFNFWALFGSFFQSDRTHILGLSLHVWGDLIFIGFAGLIYWRFALRREAERLYEAAMLVLLAFFIFMPEMHERYLYYAVVFCGVLIGSRSYAYGAVILSLTLLLNMEYGLTFMYLDDAKVTAVDRFRFAPWLIVLCSLANIGVLFGLLRDYLRAAIVRPIAGRFVNHEPAGMRDAAFASANVASE